MKGLWEKTIYPTVCSVDLKLLFNLSSYLSNSFQKMKHLFQGEKKASWGKKKINSLGWSYYFLFILLILFFPAYFPGFNLSYLFHPQYFRTFCFFSLYGSSSNVSEELSVINHIYIYLFSHFCCSLKHFYEYFFREAMVL